MKHDDAPYRRWDPKPAWLAVHFFPPERYVFHTVKRGEDGMPFKAKLGSDGYWRDEGELIINNANLYWLSQP